MSALAGLLVALSALLLAGSAYGQGPAPKVVRFGVQPSFREVEEKFNTKIEFVSFPFGGPQNNAFAAGELEFSQKGMAPCAVAMQRAKAKLLVINILEQTAIISLPEIGSVPFRENSTIRVIPSSSCITGSRSRTTCSGRRRTGHGWPRSWTSSCPAGCSASRCAAACS